MKILMVVLLPYPISLVTPTPLFKVYSFKYNFYPFLSVLKIAKFLTHNNIEPDKIINQTPLFQLQILFETVKNDYLANFMTCISMPQHNSCALLCYKTVYNSQLIL